MSWWNVIAAVGLPLIQDAFMGDDKDNPDSALVKPTPPKPIFDRSDIKPFEPRDFRYQSSKPGPVGAEPALKSVTPSQIDVEARYWQAMFSDARKKSEIK